MNEYKNTQLAADMQSFATALVKAASDIATAAYDLREACRFYTEGDVGRIVELPAAGNEAGERYEADPAAVSGGSCTGNEGAHEMEHGEGAGAGQPGDEETPRHVTSARLEHLKRVQLHKAVKMPDTLTAASVLNGRKRVFITEYYREFNEYCRAHGLYELDRKGMRYLAYCNGYKKREGSGCTELIKN